MEINLALKKRVAWYREKRVRRFAIEALATITLLAVSVFLTNNLNELPDMQSIEDANQRKATFFSYLEPIVAARNRDILAQRKKLLSFADTYQHDKKLPFYDEFRLKSLAQQYAVDWNESELTRVIERLKKRIDTVPVSLVLVQAAKESGWGTSRFAREGNNLFGQWCYSPGCGIIPAKRSSNTKHEVRVFGSVEEAVDAYLHNINTGDAYSRLRDIRAQLRKAGKTPDGKSLADGLLYYSQRREAYVQEVKLMLDQYHQFQLETSG